MTKLFLMLCMSALAFTGCFVTPSAEGYSSISGRNAIESCKNSPQLEPCPDLLTMTEMSPKEAKPVMKLKKNSTDMLYGASNPSAWEGGYSNLPVVDENGDDILYTTNFSVEKSGSVLATGMEYKYSYFAGSLVDMKLVGQPREFIPRELGGDKFEATESNFKGSTVIRLMIFPALRKYFFMPPMRFAP